MKQARTITDLNAKFQQRVRKLDVKGIIKEAYHKPVGEFTI